MERIKIYLRHKILGLIKFILDNAGNDLNKLRDNTYLELERIVYRDSAQFLADNIGKAVLFSDDVEFWTHALEAAPKNGLVLEFGVYGGRSINIFADVLKRNADSRTIYGFDSFEGLSEDFSGTTMSKGTFSLGGQLPDVAPNVELIKGWVDQTLPGFVEEKSEDLAFMNVDFDTYTPTKIVFENLISRIQEGSVIVFDELIGFPGWREHEYKVLIEMMPENYEYEFIGFCQKMVPQYLGSYVKAAIRISKIHT
jgi:predicted O-methyltransferase YrrM